MVLRNFWMILKINGDGNGSQMRLTPAVCFTSHNLETAMHVAVAQSRTTHAPPSCRFAAGLIFMLLRGQDYETAKKGVLSLGWSDKLAAAICTPQVGVDVVWFRLKAMCWTAWELLFGVSRTPTLSRTQFYLPWTWAMTLIPQALSQDRSLAPCTATVQSIQNWKRDFLESAGSTSRLSFWDDQSAIHSEVGL